MRSRITACAVLIWGAAFGLVMGVPACDSNSGSSAQTCGAACVDADSGLVRDYNVESKSPSSDSLCDELLNEVTAESSDFTDPVCGNNLVSTPSSGGCDAEGALFTLRLTLALAECTIVTPPPTLSCIRDFFEARDWEYSGNCLECGVTASVDFGSCVNSRTPLLSEDVSECVGEYVTAVNGCSP